MSRGDAKLCRCPSPEWRLRPPAPVRPRPGPHPPAREGSRRCCASTPPAASASGASPAVAALGEHEFFRLCVPSEYGGGEASVRELVESRRRSRKPTPRRRGAWRSRPSADSGRLPEPDAAQEVYGVAGRAVGGVFAPKGRAEVAADGFRVSGRWPFASGVEHCDWLMGGWFVVRDGVAAWPGGALDVRLLLWPRDRLELIDTWSVAGLRATGSHDMAVTGLHVPHAWSASIFTDATRIDGAPGTFPLFGLLALAIAGVALGIARAALDRPDSPRRLQDARGQPPQPR